jgi:hypothetical protein
MSLKAARERKRTISAALCEGQETYVRPESQISCNRRALPVDKHVGKEVFHVTLWRPAVKTCYGCKMKFREKHKKQPTNVIVKEFCHRLFTNIKGERVKSKRLTDAYFNLNMDCIGKYNPHARIADTIVHEEIEQGLNDEQLVVLRKFGLMI